MKKLQGSYISWKGIVKVCGLWIYKGFKLAAVLYHLQHLHLEENTKKVLSHCNKCFYSQCFVWVTGLIQSICGNLRCLKGYLLDLHLIYHLNRMRLTSQWNSVLSYICRATFSTNKNPEKQKVSGTPSVP